MCLPGGPCANRVQKEIILTNVTGIAPDVYRISACNPDYDLSFNPFRVKDDEPLLLHTGTKKKFS